jgi:hypothetical protein
MKDGAMKTLSSKLSNALKEQVPGYADAAKSAETFIRPRGR